MVERSYSSSYVRLSRSNDPLIVRSASTNALSHRTAISRNQSYTSLCRSCSGNNLWTDPLPPSSGYLPMTAARRRDGGKAWAPNFVLTRSPSYVDRYPHVSYTTYKSYMPSTAFRPFSISRFDKQQALWVLLYTFKSHLPNTPLERKYFSFQKKKKKTLQHE